jgi:1-acyl-sn-glycerol-3-phosphate acyltransferase
MAAKGAVPLRAGEGRGRPTPRRGSTDALAAGAARASGERARRRRTPLISDPNVPDDGAAVEDPRTTGSPRAAAGTAGGTEARTAGASRSEPSPTVHRPRPVPRSSAVRLGKAASGERSETRPARPRTRRTVRRTDAPPLSSVPSLPPEAPVQEPGAGAAGHLSGIEELVHVAVSVLRVAAEASGLSGEDVERQVAGTLAFVRRRLSGDYTVDEFGFDEDFTEHAYLPLLRPLYRSWFRVEVRGIENIPAEGGALVVANHSGTIALDSLMTQVAVHDEHPARRHLRMLGADLVFQTPVVGDLARKSGSTLAANTDAERLLASGELTGVWPEGFKGVGKPYSERYKLQRFGRGGFVAAALRTGAPIIPCSIVGAEEIYPILGNLKTVARLLGAPYVPITPTFPLLGPLGLIPLPSKWIIEFGSPVETASLGPSAADDPMLVFDLTDQVRETIQQTLYALLMQRRSVFF